MSSSMFLMRIERSATSFSIVQLLESNSIDFVTALPIACNRQRPYIPTGISTLSELVKVTEVVMMIVNVESGDEALM